MSFFLFVSGCFNFFLFVAGFKHLDHHVLNVCCASRISECIVFIKYIEFSFFCFFFSQRSTVIIDACCPMSQIYYLMSFIWFFSCLIQSARLVPVIPTWLYIDIEPSSIFLDNLY